MLSPSRFFHTFCLCVNLNVNTNTLIWKFMFFRIDTRKAPQLSIKRNPSSIFIPKNQHWASKLYRHLCVSNRAVPRAAPIKTWFYVISRQPMTKKDRLYTKFALLLDSKPFSHRADGKKRPTHSSSWKLTLVRLVQMIFLKMDFQKSNFHQQTRKLYHIVEICF